MSSIRHEYKRLGVFGTRMAVKFREPDMRNLNTWAHKCMIELLNLLEIDMKISPQDRVGFIFSNGENDKINFGISFRRFDQYSADLILSLLDVVLQSNTNFLLDDTLVISVDVIKVPIGFGRRTNIGKSFEDFYKVHRKSIYLPNITAEDGNICLAVAVLLGKIYADGEINQNLYNSLVYPQNHDDLVNQSNKLAQDAGVNLVDGGGLDEIMKFQEYLSNEYNLTVYSSRDGRSVYYKSPYKNRKNINLLLDNNHFSLIKSLTAAFASSYFCSYCAEPYSTRLAHRNCPFKCERCLESPPCETLDNVNCSECNRIFLNQQCFNNHLENKVCLNIRHCTDCTKTFSYSEKRPHVCGSAYCFLCKEYRSVRHECYIPFTPPKSTKFNTELYVFFDLECSQNTQFPNNELKFIHKPNLCVAHQACDICCENDNIDIQCENCFNREHIFYDGDIIKKFMNYLGAIPERFKRITVLAHNLQKYDGHFILQYMYFAKEQWPLKEDCLIINGTKILQIKVGRYRFIDSLNFFSVPLAKLPAMFNLRLLPIFF